MRYLTSIVAALVVVHGLTGQHAGAAQPPATAKKPVTDTLHGVAIVDDYRWLEDWNDPAVKAWSEAQNAHARSVLDKLPEAPAIRKRATELMTGEGVDYSGLQVRGPDWYAIKHDPARQQPLLVVMTGRIGGLERVLVDANAVDAKGLTTIDWFEVSPDGALVAVSMSEGGSESGTVHVFSTVTGERTGDAIPRAHGGTAGGSLAWDQSNTGFYYTRYPRKGERPDEDLDFYVQVYYHKIGDDPSKDRYEIGKDFVKIAEIVLEAGENGEVLASVQKGDGGEFEHFLRTGNPKEPWSRLTRFEDGCVQATLDGRGGITGSVYFVSRKDAPRGKVLRGNLQTQQTPTAVTTSVVFTEVIPVATDGAAIETNFFEKTGLLSRGSKLYVWYQNGGPNEVRVFDLTRAGTVWSKLLGKLPAPPVSTTGEVVVIGNDIVYHSESFVTPPTWTATTTPVPGQTTQAPPMFQRSSPANYSDCEVIREFATSKDGTRVPMIIIRSRRLGELMGQGGQGGQGGDIQRRFDDRMREEADARAARMTIAGAPLLWPAPTILWGYGGYGVNETPTFSARRRLFIEQGGVYVIANIRGGGEFGEEWHTQGNLLNKQNVFDDFHACAKWLIDNKYTTREKLAIMGGSNGGLLMGATFTQHPDLCKAVVSSVGIYDMLRVELSSNGAFNITEFGTVKDKAQFDALHAYSPYHGVKDGTTYPNVLFLTGANDPRVDPMQSRKMTARLQAASPGSKTLLRTSANAGHGIGSSLAQRVEETVDIYAFVMDELGMKYGPVPQVMPKGPRPIPPGGPRPAPKP